MSFINHINKTDPIIKLLIICIFFYLLTNISSLNNYRTKQEDSRNSYIIQIERDNLFAVTHIVSKNNLNSTALPLPTSTNQIKNGTKYYLSKEKQIYKTSKVSGKHKISLGIPININSASIEDLTALPTIGPVTARKIIDYRESNNSFESLEELTKVEGIGEKKYNIIKQYLSL